MADRKEGKKLTADERFAVKNKMLDDRIAMNTEMKKILTSDQYGQLETMKKEHHKNFKNKRKFHKNHNRR